MLDRTCECYKVIMPDKVLNHVASPQRDSTGYSILDNDKVSTWLMVMVDWSTTDAVHHAHALTKIILL